MNWMYVLCILATGAIAEDSLLREKRAPGRNCPRIKNFPGRVKYKRRGTRAQFRCPRTYIRYGNKVVNCRADNTWSGEPPVCVKSGCVPVDIQNFDKLDMKEMYGGALLSFSCEDDFQLIGIAEIYCDSKVWSAVPPVCKATAQLTECDFEQDLCGWSQDDSDDLDWARNQGQTSTGGTGPKTDHTLQTIAGHYMFVESSNPARNGDQARLVSPTYPSDMGNMCFDFWYHLLGPDDQGHVGSLEVFIRGDSEFIEDLQPVFIKDGNQGDVWQRGDIYIDKRDEPFQIVIVTTRKLSYISDIAIDDVRLYNCSGTTTTTPATTTVRTTTPTTTTMKSKISTIHVTSMMSKTKSTSSEISSTAKPSTAAPRIETTFVTANKTSFISTTSTGTTSVSSAQMSSKVPVTLVTRFKSPTPTATLAKSSSYPTASVQSSTKVSTTRQAKTQKPVTSQAQSTSKGVTFSSKPATISTTSKISTTKIPEETITTTIKATTSPTTLKTTQIQTKSSTVKLSSSVTNVFSSTEKSTTANAVPPKTSRFGTTQPTEKSSTTKLTYVSTSKAMTSPSPSKATASTVRASLSTVTPFFSTKIQSTKAKTTRQATQTSTKSSTLRTSSNVPTTTFKTPKVSKAKPRSTPKPTSTTAITTQPSTRKTTKQRTRLFPRSSTVTTTTPTTHKSTSKMSTVVGPKSSSLRTTKSIKTKITTRIKDTTVVTKTSPDSTQAVNKTKSIASDTTTATVVNDTEPVVRVAESRSQHPADETLKPLMIGLGVGIVAGLIIIGVVAWVCVRRRKFYTSRYEDELKPITKSSSSENFNNVQYEYHDDEEYQ